MRIRPAVLDDVEAIARNHVASWQAGYRGLIADEVLDALDVGQRVERWRNTVLRDAPGEALLVVDEGGPRGHAHVAPATRPHHEGGEIISLYLPPDAWGHGWGKALLVAAGEALVERGTRPSASGCSTATNGPRASTSGTAGPSTATVSPSS